MQMEMIEIDLIDHAVSWFIVTGLVVVCVCRRAIGSTLLNDGVNRESLK